MFKRARSLDLMLYIFPILLWLIGCAVLWSLTYASPDHSIARLAIKQLVYGLIGLVLSAVMVLIDYRSLRQFAWLISIITLLLLLAVEFFGATSLGATRWLDFKIFQLQPSEIAKIALVIVYATYLLQYLERVTYKMFILASVVLLPPLVLVLKQPDLGTAIILVLTALAMIISVHLKPKHYIPLACVIAAVLLVGALSFNKIGPFDRLMHDYQRDRIHTFIDPGADPLGKGYNVRQAVIAIGNGGLKGKGLGKEVGQLSQLNLLPKAYTDFIFAALAESLGFIGAGLVLILFGGLLWRIMTAASIARDGFGALLCYGYLSTLAFSILINIGMNLGIMPVTGIPLPFISAGGTALIVNFIGIGLLQSVVSRRQKIQFD